MATPATAGSKQSINTELGVPGRGGGYKREMGKRGEGGKGVEGSPGLSHDCEERGGGEGGGGV